MKQKIDLLDDRLRPERVIWYLAWPTILEQLLITLVQYVDTGMVGSLGENATAAIAISSSTTWLINGIFAAVAVGFSVPIGRYIGAGEFDKAKAVVRQAFMSILFVGIAATIAFQSIAAHLPVWLGADPAIIADATAYVRIVSAAYMFNVAVQISGSILRCAGDTRTPLIFNVTTNVINVVLNFLFIYAPRTISIFSWEFHMWGANMGVRGAALATAISISFSGIMLTRALFRSASPIGISLRDKFRLNKAIWKDMVKLGSPVAFERATLSLGQVFMTAMVTSLGTTHLAAHHLAITAESITYMPAFGFSAAATTLVAQSQGAGKPELAYRYGKFCTLGGVIFMTAMGFVLYFGGHTLLSLLTPVPEVIALGGDVLKIEAFAQPFFGLAVIISGVLRGARDTKWPFYISLIGMWLIRLPIAYSLLNFTTLGLAGLWVGMLADLFVRGSVSFFRFRGKKWLKNDINVIEEVKNL